MAISLTAEQLAYRCGVMAALKIDEVGSEYTWADVWEMINTAVKKVCEQAVEGKEWERLQTQYSVTLSGGQATLNDASITKTLKPRFGGRCWVAGLPSEYFEEFNHLILPRAGSRYGYHVSGGNQSGGTVEVYAPDGTAYSGNATLWICNYQDFSTLAPQFEDELTILLTNMAKAKATGQPLGV